MRGFAGFGAEGDGGEIGAVGFDHVAVGGERAACLLNNGGVFERDDAAESAQGAPLTNVLRVRSRLLGADTQEAFAAGHIDGR